MGDGPKLAVTNVPVDALIVGRNVRRDVGDLTDLTASIRRLGVLQPLVCVPSDDNLHVEVLMGQRRLAAAKAAGLTHVPCILRPRPPALERVLAQLAENHHRADMSPVDEAAAFADLLGHGLTREQISATIGRSYQYVLRRLAVLELPDSLRLAVDVGWINLETALSVIPRELLRDRQDVAALAQVLPKGDRAVREWCLARMAARHLATPPARAALPKVQPRRSVDGQQLVARIRPDLHARALAAAKTAGLSLAAWLEALIESHVPEGAS